MTNSTAPSFDTLIEGLDLSVTEEARTFLARVFRERLDRRDYSQYIDQDLAGDFACALAAYIAPVIKAADEAKEVVPAPFQLGNFYRTLEGKLVRFVKIHNEGNSYETMEDEAGVNRYTLRDLGRVTGTDHHNPDPRNVLPIYHVPSEGSSGIGAELKLKWAMDEIESLKAQLAQVQSQPDAA